MASPDDLIRQGDVAGARAALVEEVRAKPDNRPARMFLSQVLLLLGEWDKALTHMKAIANLSPEALTLFAAYDRVVTAEKVRAAVFTGKSAPAALVPSPGPWFDALLGALAADLKGDDAAAAGLRAKAFDEAPETPGNADGKTFKFIADADARFGPALEVILDGRYGLIPFEAVASVTSEGAKDLRDFVWLPARLTLKSGQAGNVFLPVRYPGAEADADALIQLGRKTVFDGRGELGNVGRGQRVFDADDAEVSLLELRKLSFDV